MTELKPCPFCGAKADVLADRHRVWGLIQHKEGCLFPTFPKHEIPESEFEAWNTRRQCGLTDEDYSILLDELGVSERTCHNKARYGNFKCDECGAFLQLTDFDDEPMLTVDGVGCLPDYCPHCGAKVVSE